MESILAVAFGRKVNIQQGEADELTKAAASIFCFSKKIIDGGLVTNLISMHVHGYHQYNICCLVFTVYLHICIPAATFAPLQKILKFIARFSIVSDHWRVLYFTTLNLVQARRKETGQVRISVHATILSPTVCLVKSKNTSYRSFVLIFTRKHDYEYVHSSTKTFYSL